MNGGLGYPGFPGYPGASFRDSAALQRRAADWTGLNLIGGAGLTPAAGTLIRGDIVGTNLLDADDNTDRNSYTSTHGGIVDFAVAANRGLIAIITQTGTSCTGPSSITYGGLTFVRAVETASGNSNSHISIWVAQTSSAITSQAITVAFNSGESTTGIHIAVSSFAGVSLAGSNGSDIYVSSNNVSNAASAATSVAITLPNALGNAKNAMLYGVTAAANEVITGATSFTALGQKNHANPVRSCQYGYRINVTTGTPTWTSSVTSRYCAIELKAA